MRVVEIWRFPVKSMGGESLLAAEVTELGIVGDRGWGLHDLASGTVLTARRTPELLFASARLVDAVFKRIDRCVMVTRPQPGLERDLDVLRAINAERGQCLAIGALVAEPGELALGSAVRQRGVRG